jgi:aspartate ammonia-lyase
MLGGHRGIYDPVRPNDDVNASQSTNDVYPTAIRVSVLLAHVQLDAAIERLAAAFADRAAEFETVLKLGRTQLQDAVPMTLGQEFMAFANALRRDRCRLRDAVQLLSVVNLGGTAIGTGLNAPAGYSKSAIAELSAICGHALLRADDLIEASWDVSAFVVFSGALKALATKLSKIANDLRLLSSGPRGGLGEIILPQTQPGSSIMPGKVNPVIPEVVNQVAFQVIGNDLAITLAAEAGQLQLNAMEPLIAGNLHVSIQIMTGAITALAENCVSGISADAARCRANLDASVAVATALVPEVGYARSVEIANDALRLGRRIVDLTVERGILSRERAEDLLDPGNLVRPQGRAEQGNIA